jgi:hypothetical protein
MTQARALTLCLRNALLSAFVFLPVLLLVAPLEGAALGAPLEGGFSPHVGYALFLYVAFVVPVILGSLVHSLAVLLASVAVPAARPTIVAFVCSPLLCATLFLIGGVDGASLLLERPAATATATVAYGLASALWEKRSLARGNSVTRVDL